MPTEPPTKLIEREHLRDLLDLSARHSDGSALRGLFLLASAGSLLYLFYSLVF